MGITRDGHPDSRCRGTSRREARHARSSTATARRLLNANKGRQRPLFDAPSAAACASMGWTALESTSEVILAAANDTSTEARAPRIPIARMRIALPARRRRAAPGQAAARQEHEHLRTTYERMLEKGAERFQVKPSGLPAMDHLYDELPNFHDALDDVKRQIALCQDSRDALEITPHPAARPARRRQDALRARDRRAARHRHGLRLDELADRRLGAERRLQPVEGRAPGQGVRDAGRRRVRQPGDGGRRDRQGRAASTPTTRWARCTACWSTTPPRPSPTSSPRCRSTPAR